MRRCYAVSVIRCAPCETAFMGTEFAASDQPNWLVLALLNLANRLGSIDWPGSRG